MRCESCSKITIADIRSCEVLQKPSFKALESSANSGCDLCNLSCAAVVSNYSGSTMKFEGKDMSVVSLLRDGQNPARADSPDTSVYLEGDLADYHECDQLREKVEKITVRIGELSPGQNSIYACLKIGVDPGSILTKYIAGRSTSQSPQDPTTVARIRGWIEKCDQKHKYCEFLSTERPLPKRILNISKDRPVVVSTHAAKGRYVALSYCWGPSGKNLLLTRSTFDELTSIGINVNALPKTVQDAIIVCRTLDVQYLWVDALCIVQRQPNLEDFIAEAPRMSEYYKNAYLTLIAGSAQDCADGFLTNRDDPKAAPCELAYDRKVFTSDGDMKGFVKVFIPPTQAIGPTQSRAWCFQELKLSQRYLIYGPEQVRITCPSMSVFEDGAFQKVYKPTAPLPSDPTGYPDIHHLVRHENKAEVIGRAFQLWIGVLYDYTVRGLSDSQDKLAAIAGYASLVQGIVQCRYMYGLWEDFLLAGLLWKTRRPRLSPDRGGITTRSSNRAPSWSWASIDGPIVQIFSSAAHNQFKDPEQCRLEILSYDRVSHSFDPIGEASINMPQAFELAVRGWLRAVWHVSSLSGNPSEFMLSESPVSAATIRSTGPQNAQTLATGIWDTYEDYERGTYCDQQIYGILLMRDVGLLLTHVDDKRYRRIGYFRRSKVELFMNTSPQDVILI